MRPNEVQQTPLQMVYFLMEPLHSGSDCKVNAVTVGVDCDALLARLLQLKKLPRASGYSTKDRGRPATVTNFSLRRYCSDPILTESS